MARVSTGLVLAGAALTQGATGFVTPTVPPRAGQQSRALTSPWVGDATPFGQASRVGSAVVMPLPERTVLTAHQRLPNGVVHGMRQETALSAVDGRRSELSRTPTRGESNANSNGPRKAPIIRVETLEEFKKEVADEKNRMVAVKFFSPTCRACKAMSPSFKALSVKYPDVKFVEVPLTQNNAMLHQGLGVPSFPFGHLYHPDVGLVEEGSINRKRIGDFEQKLQTYIAGACDFPEKEKNL